MLTRPTLVLFAALVAGTVPLHAGSQHRSSWSNPLQSHTIDINEGTEFTPDLRGIKNIPFGGYVEVEERKGWSIRRVRVEPGPGGKLVTTYWVGGTERAMDEEAKAWFATQLMEGVRESGVGAETRVPQIMKERGAEGVLGEISHIRSNGGKVRYFEQFILRNDLSPQVLRIAMKQIGREIGSNGDKTRLMLAVAEKYRSPETRSALLDATDTISSSGDKTHLLVELMRQPVSDPQWMAGILRAAEDIPSNGDKAHVLITAAPLLSANDLVRRNFFRTLGTITSSGDTTQVLLRALEGTPWRTDANRNRFLTDVTRSTLEIHASGDKATVLRAVAPHLTRDPQLRRAFFEAAGAVPSSGDLQSVLLQVVEQKKIDTEVVVDAVRSAAENVHSMGDRASVLSAAATRFRTDPTVRAAVEAAARDIHSDGDYRRVMDALR